MYSRVHVFLLIILVGLIISCSESDSTQQTITEKDIAFDQLELFLSFEADSIASPADIAFLNSDTLAIFDNKLTSILLYDTNGSLVKTFGSKGKGPGEFVRPAGMRIIDDRIFVLDFGNFGINEFDGEGKFIKRHTFEGKTMGFAQTSILESESYLSPANGKNGSLLYLEHSADSSFYFGEAPADEVGAVNLEQAKNQIRNGEIPDMFKNTALTAYDDESFYAFLQSYGKMQRYNKDGQLLWEETIELPVKEKIFDQFVERNQNVQSNAIYPLSYAMAMQVTSDALYVLMNAPEGEKQVLIKFDKDGQTRTIYRIDSREDDFNNFTVSPSEDTLFFTDLSLGRIYRMHLQDG